MLMNGSNSNHYGIFNRNKSMKYSANNCPIGCNCYKRLGKKIHFRHD